MSDQIKIEEILQYFKEEATKPVSVEELEERFNVTSSDMFKELITTLNELEGKGEIIRTRTNRYGIPEKLNLIRGRVQGHAKGFAFVIPDEGDEDVYVPQGSLSGAMNGDIVFVRIDERGSGSRAEGKVIRIIERKVTEIVGELSLIHI